MPNSNTSERYRPRLVGQRNPADSEVRYTLRRGARLGSLTPRAGLEANNRSVTASSSTRAQHTEPRSLLSPPRAAPPNSATHACMSVWRTSPIGVLPHRGAIWIRHALA